MKKTLVLALAAIMVLGVAGAAFAGSATYADTDSGATKGTAGPGSVAVTAKTNPKITLTITTPDGAGTQLLLDWATTPLDPGTDPAAKKVSLVVDSNKDFAINVDETGMTPLTTAGFTYTRNLTAGVDGYTKGDDRTFEDSVDLGPVSYSITPDQLFTGQLVYTAIQNP